MLHALVDKFDNTLHAVIINVLPNNSYIQSSVLIFFQMLFHMLELILVKGVVLYFMTTLVA